MRRSMKLYIIAGLVVVAAAVGTWYGFSRHGAVKATTGSEPVSTDVVLTPVAADAGGIDPATSFKLTVSKALSPAEASTLLTVTPAVALRVTREDQAGHRYTVTPARMLEADRVYRFQLAGGGVLPRSYNWAFQTSKQFRVLGSLPRHQGTGVPVNTGIEVTFSHANYADLTGFFAISPKADGRFERHGRTVAFVPAAPLSPGTLYSVTVKKGLKQTDGKGVLAQDFSFAFETQAQTPGKAEPTAFYMPADPQEFPAGEPPYFAVSYGFKPGTAQAPQLDIAVYRFPDAKAYAGALGRGDALPLWASYTRSQSREDVAQLSKVTGFKSQPKEFAGQSGPYVLFPEPLNPGYYIAEFSANGSTRQVLFQVTNLSTYVSLTQTRSLLWVNDLGSKAPVAGAKVSVLNGSGAATTDAGGIATVSTPPAPGPEQATAVYLHVRTDDGRETVAGTSAQQYYAYNAYSIDTALATNYWKYLYLDRLLYKPEDTVNAWGVLRPREPGGAPVDEVTLALIRNDYRGDGDGPVPVATSTVKVQNGTFIGSVKLPTVKTGGYELQVRAGESIITSRWLQVATYTKPAYQISVTADKQAVFTGEPLALKVHAAFFEGTPAPNLKLRLAISGWCDTINGDLTTDVNGDAAYTYRPQGACDGQSRGPQTAWINVYANGPEAGEISAQTTAMVFGRNVLLEPQAGVDGNQARIFGKVSLVDLARLNAGAEGSGYTGGPAAGLTVRGTVIENNWIQEDDGQYYDFITKAVQKKYRYRSDPKTIGTFGAATDTKGQFMHSLAINPEKSYNVKLEVLDTNGEPVTLELYFSGRQYQGLNTYGYRWFQLETEPRGKYQWARTDEAALVFKENGGAVADRAKGFLFYTARLGLQSVTLQGSGTFRYKFQPTDPPGVSVYGVYFDGRMYREGANNLRFDPKDFALSTRVSTDKPAYRPGEAVTVNVEVRDRQGKPAKGATVNLNLVDEALYALRDQQVNLLGGLLSDWLPTGVLSTRTSHNAPEARGGAEKGGEGGGARNNFQDAVLFTAVTTNADGKASVSFKVPDNLTSWRLTYQALQPATMEGDSGTLGIPVRLPFFVDLVLGGQYLTGDKPVVVARSYGTQLAAGTRVSYALTMTGPGGTSSEVKAEGDAFGPVSLPLPALQAGAYTVRVSGSGAGGLSDTIEKGFAVTDSYLTQTKMGYLLLGAGTRVDGAVRGVTTLTFTDAQRGRYLRSLQSLQWQWGNRLEQKLARSVAADLLTRYFDRKGEAGAEPDADVLGFQTPDGGMAILPYADADLKLSALVADLAPEKVDRTALALYLQKVTDEPNGSRDRAVQALYGLAALDRPVLVQVKALLSQKDLTFEEQLYLLLAQSALGDVEGARPGYLQLVKDQVKTLGENAYYGSGKSADETAGYTALLSVLAARLGDEKAPGMIGYLLETPPQESLVLLEQALAARAALPQLKSAAVSFTYVLEGKEVTKELKPGQAFTLPVPADKLGGLQFKSVKGQVGLLTAYEAPLAGDQIVAQQGFTLSRTYAVDGRRTNSFAAGDLVKVSIAYGVAANAPNGPYEVSEYLPSGLALVQRPWNRASTLSKGEYLGWPMAVTGQQVRFYADKNGAPITYFARVTTPGEFTADPPTLQHQRSGQIMTAGKREQVTIK